MNAKPTKRIAIIERTTSEPVWIHVPQFWRTYVGDLITMHRLGRLRNMRIVEIDESRGYPVHVIEAQS
jgi:hypothetical protein